MVNEIIRDANNRVIGISRREYVDLNNYGLFLIHGGDMDIPIGTCKPDNLEKVHCSCGGEIKITNMAHADYSMFLEVELTCIKCAGRYVGISVKRKEDGKNVF